MSEDDVVDRVTYKLSAESLLANESLAALDSNFHELCAILAEQSRTSKLWAQYMQHVQLLHSFVTAERMSNWEQHLNAVSMMIPLFAATNHFNYAKSAYVYIQLMRELAETCPWLSNLFQQGLHTMRKSDRYWAGLSTDLVIEQDMMAAVKGKGGLT